MKSLASRWWTFTQERFHLGAHLPLVLLFAFANYYVPLQVDFLHMENSRLVLFFFLILSFFFRMRVFDEIKDYEVDLKVNPHRPLARKLLSIRQARVMILFLFLFEALLALSMGQMVFMFYLLPAFYSILMFEEFFIGDWIRTHLTTYAVSHTFVSFLLSMLGFVIATHTFGFQDEIFAFFLMNWCYFNLFEFARKSFAPAEEKPNVESYSRIFSPRGAVLLSLSQMLLGLYLTRQFSFNFTFVMVGGAFYFLLTLPALLKPQPQTFKIFRNGTGVYLLLHYALLVLSMRWIV